jgi:hypothetical protein
MSDLSLSGGVSVYGFIAPLDSEDKYPVIDPIYGVDGLRNVVDIGSYAFNGTSSLTGFSAPNLGYIGTYGLGNSGIKEVYLPSITSLGQNAFYACSQLTGITLPSLIQTYQYSFQNCSSIQIADFPNATSLGQRALAYCTQLKNVYLPKTTSLSSDVFQGDTSLSGVTIGLATIASGGLLDYIKPSLSELNLTQATTLGDYAFNGYSALTSISAVSATTIGHYTFNNCTALVSINIPVVNSMGVDVFLGITGNTITLTIPQAFLDTNNSNIQYLTGATQSNVVTIIAT